MNRDIIIVAHDIRSCHNVGAILRTAEGMGVSQIILSGYTPYPLSQRDGRLPHESAKITKQIHKTALGAEDMVNWNHDNRAVFDILSELQNDGYEVCALEQSPLSVSLSSYTPSKEKIAVVIGREVEGVEEAILQVCDVVLEIPMLGHKESFNVVQATAIALYRLRFLP